MATFSTDQVRQLYIALSKETSVTNVTPDGGMNIVKTPEDVFISYKSPNSDTPVRSDLIPIKNVTCARASKARERKLKLFSVKLDPTVNGGNPIAGQDYVLSISFDFLGSYDNKTYETVAYRVKSTDTATTVIQGLADILNKSLKTNPIQAIKVTAVGTTLNIEELESDWVLGKKRDRSLIFLPRTTKVNDNGNDVPWGIVKDITATNTNVIKNGKTTADMEYFYLGERADIYRNMGYPNNFNNKYLVDPTKEYEFIDIEYFYAGDAEDIQKSKKMISIAAIKGSAYDAAAIAADITAAGITVDVSQL